MKRRIVLFTAFLVIMLISSGFLESTLSTNIQTEFNEDVYFSLVASQSILYGDVNSDEQVTNVDLILLKRYIAGIPVDNFDLQAADVNGDEQITNVDIILLSRYIVGIIDTLGPPELPANAVIEIINAINNPPVQQQVEEARSAYDALTPDQKELVTNYQRLIEAEQALAEVFLRDDTIIRIESFSKREFYVHHSSAQRAKVDPVINPIEDSYFRLVPGLANSNLVSIESVNHPGSFLRSKNGEIWLDSNNGTNSFKGDATWHKRNGLSDATGVSFESYNNTGQYIRNNNKLLITGSASTEPERRSATFYVRPNYSAYIMSYFKESSGGQDNSHALQLAYSFDAMNWVPLNQNNPVLIPTLGERGLRDPFILRKQDGTFIILGTNMWFSHDIHVFDSADLITFNGRLLRMRDGTLPGNMAWAPKAIWDPARQQYGIYWSIHKNSIRVNYTADFKTVGPPQVFFDPGHWVIDAAFIQYDNMNYLYYKDERYPEHPSGHGMTIKGAYSHSLDPGSFNSNYYAGPFGPAPIEGPMPVKVINESRWIMYGDNYFPANGVFFGYETTNLAGGNWTEMNRRNYNQPISSKHGSIVKVTMNELDKLIARYGNPQWNRLKSYNRPRQYIRHLNGTVRLDQYPIVPVRNTMWKIVPGLADPDGISFESIDHPGNFLRHANFILRLDANNNTQAFKEDATFYKEPGLADSSWSSFKSYNYPDLYIRNTIFEMRIDSITNDAGKEAATYKIEY